MPGEVVEITRAEEEAAGLVDDFREAAVIAADGRAAAGLGLNGGHAEHFVVAGGEDEDVGHVVDRGEDGFVDRAEIEAVVGLEFRGDGIRAFVAELADGTGDDESNIPAFGADAVVTTSRTWTVNTSRSPLRLNEILAANSGVLVNAGATPDAIELHNESATAVNLAGIRLTDDLTAPDKFIFPAGDYATKVKTDRKRYFRPR